MSLLETDVPLQDARDKVDYYITSEQEDVRKKAEEMLAGVITIAAFFAFMRKRLTLWHNAAASLAFDGLHNLTSSAHSKLQQTIENEIHYLDSMRTTVEQTSAVASRLASQIVKQSLGLRGGIAGDARDNVEKALMRSAPSQAIDNAVDALKDILPEDLISEEDLKQHILQTVPLDNLTDLKGGTIPSRAASYANAAYSTFQNSLLEKNVGNGIRLARRACMEDKESCSECVDEAERDWVDVRTIPAIGSLKCRNHCRCAIEYWKWADTKSFDPTEARDERGRWTRDDDSEKSNDQQLKQSLTAYAEDFGTAKLIQNDSRKVIKGLEDDKSGYYDEATDIVEAIRNAPEQNVPLYRGLNFKKPFLPLEKAEPGATLNLDRISSFTSARDIAAYYADSSPVEGEYKYELQIHGKSKSLFTDTYTDLSHKEYVTEGRFRVKAVLPPETVHTRGNTGFRADYRKVIVLEQLGVF
jgi:hypothetical protein